MIKAVKVSIRAVVIRALMGVSVEQHGRVHAALFSHGDQDAVGLWETSRFIFNFSFRITD